MHLLCSKEMKGTAATSNQLWSFYENNFDSWHVSTVSTAGSSPKQPFTGTFMLPNRVPTLEYLLLPGYLLLPQDLPWETSGWGLEFARHWLAKRSISIAVGTSPLVKSIDCYAHETRRRRGRNWSTAIKWRSTLMMSPRGPYPAVDTLRGPKWKDRSCKIPAPVFAMKAHSGNFCQTILGISIFE